jgi:hypothetical protein
MLQLKCKGSIEEEGRKEGRVAPRISASGFGFGARARSRVVFFVDSMMRV